MIREYAASRMLWVALVAFAPAAALANDEWEANQGFGDDDTSATSNQLVHGSRQRHDLQFDAALDQDWSVVSVHNRHSYEALGFNSTFSWVAFGGSATMDRVDAAGTVLTPGVLNEGQSPGTSVVVRWMATADTNEYVRVVGYSTSGMDANAKYDVLFRETTVNIPRWNQSGTQVTVVLLRNTSAAPIAGELHFYNTAGADLATQAVSIPAHGLQAINTATIPALSGLSGSAALAHTGPYAAIAGKAVALEPATGFTFDTPALSIPY